MQEVNKEEMKAILKWKEHKNEESSVAIDLKVRSNSEDSNDSKGGHPVEIKGE